MMKTEKKEEKVPSKKLGGQETTDPDNIVWGSQNLEDKFEYQGKIIGSNWGKTKDFGKGQKEQLVLEIQPTSYDGAVKKAFYPFSTKPSSKWGLFQRALEQCELNGEQAVQCHEDLVGLVFDFVDKVVIFGKDKHGTSITSKMTLPTRWVRKGIAEETVEDVEINLEVTILDIVKDQPTPIAELYTSLESKASKKDVLTAIKALEAKGKVVFEDGIVLGV